MRRQLSRAITAVTCGDSCHVGRQLSRLTTAVTSKDSCHVRGQLSLVKTAGTSMLQPFIRLRFNPFQTKQCSHWSHCFQWSLSCWQNRFSVWYGSMKAVSATISCDKTDRWFGLVWFGRLRIGVHPNPLTRVQWLSQNKFLLVWLGLSFGLIRSKRRLPGVRFQLWRQRPPHQEPVLSGLVWSFTWPDIIKPKPVFATWQWSGLARLNCSASCQLPQTSFWVWFGQCHHVGRFGLALITWSQRRPRWDCLSYRCYRCCPSAHHHPPSLSATPETKPVFGWVWLTISKHFPHRHKTS